MFIPFFIHRTIRRTIVFAVAVAAALAANSALAQPGDFARSLAADIGVVGEMGEPSRAAGFAAGMSCRVRPQDEMWVISSRHLDWPMHASDPPALKYWRWDCGTARWRKYRAEAFFQSDSAATVTMIYVHGNRIDSRQAVELGWYAYDAVVRRGGCDRPMRLVIFSWPSTRVVGTQMNDLRLKAARTNADGYYLGRLLAQIRHDVPVSLMGFSYGARVITGGLHVAAGGDLYGQQLPADSPRRTGNVRSVLMAAALHSHWLSPNCFHGRAMDATDRMLILTNRCDSILDRYHWVFKGERPQALGVSGMAWRDQEGRVRHLDCCGVVGETHDSLRYLDAQPLADVWRPYVFWMDEAN